jgi:molecular chaperone GrpE (heat shock protein)
MGAAATDSADMLRSEASAIRDQFREATSTNRELAEAMRQAAAENAQLVLTTMRAEIAELRSTTSNELQGASMTAATSVRASTESAEQMLRELRVLGEQEKASSAAERQGFIEQAKLLVAGAHTGLADLQHAIDAQLRALADAAGTNAKATTDATQQTREELQRLAEMQRASVERLATDWRTGAARLSDEFRERTEAQVARVEARLGAAPDELATALASRVDAAARSFDERVLAATELAARTSAESVESSRAEVAAVHAALRQLSDEARAATETARQAAAAAERARSESTAGAAAALATLREEWERARQESVRRGEETLRPVVGAAGELAQAVAAERAGLDEIRHALTVELREARRELASIATVLDARNTDAARSDMANAAARDAERRELTEGLEEMRRLAREAEARAEEARRERDALRAQGRGVATAMMAFLETLDDLVAEGARSGDPALGATVGRLTSRASWFADAVGLHEIAAVPGTPFDDRLHENVGRDSSGTRIARLVQRGYRYGERVLRRAQVELG